MSSLSGIKVKPSRVVNNHEVGCEVGGTTAVAFDGPASRRRDY